jgi:hypothetical protein
MVQIGTTLLTLLTLAPSASMIPDLPPLIGEPLADLIRVQTQDRLRREETVTNAAAGRNQNPSPLRYAPDTEKLLARFQSYREARPETPFVARFARKSLMCGLARSG